MSWIPITRLSTRFALFAGIAANALIVHAMPNGALPHRPFAFVENRGQANPRVRYIGSGPGFKAWFEDSAVILRNGRSTLKIAFERSVASANPTITPAEPVGARANYLQGNDPRRWQTDLPLFGAIRYSGIWPGVELDYVADEGRMKAEYLVSPGTSVKSIRLRFDGYGKIRSDGSLCIQSASGEFIEHTPALYQAIHGQQRFVAGGFHRNADGSIGFWTSNYDQTQPLIIDPSILFSGYFGGNSEDNITAVKIDSLNNIVTAGWTSSNDLPASNGVQKNYAGGVDAFVAAFLPNGGAMIYCTYLGGSGEDQALGLAIDTSRSVYVTGWTSSANFPVAAAFQTHLSGTRDAFVTKLNAAGNALIYSTYLGGSGVNEGYSISIDSADESVVCGDSTSSNLPVTSTAFQRQSGGSQDAFVAKLSSVGNTLVFLTYLGGSGIDHCNSVVVGPQGGIVLGGYTWSNNFPVAGMYDPIYQSTSGGGEDGFVAKLSANGRNLVFSTYLGGSGGSVGAPEEVNAVSVDSLYNITVAGTTSSANFPVTPGAYQTTFGGETDGFITRFTEYGLLLQSTYLGGSLSDGISALALDFYGDPYVTGSTDSPDFPVQNPIQGANGGGMDAFVVKLNYPLSALTFGTYLGGSANDGANAIAVDFETSIVVAGQTGSGNFPVAGNLANSTNEVLSSFLTKIAPSFTIGVAYGVQGGLTITTDPWHVASDIQSTVFGYATDLPIVGDWNGTGKKSIGIFRNGTWILDTDGNGVIDASDKTVLFGQPGDIPVVGDWLGTGHIALGLFRQGTFILDLSGHLTGVPTGQSDATFTFGQGGDLPVAADWNGSGTTKVGIFRNGLWLVDYTGSRVYTNAHSYVYGQAGDLPVVGDWDSSGHPSKIGIYRAGLWVLNYDGNNLWNVPYVTEMVLGFGFAGYTPLVF